MFKLRLKYLHDRLRASLLSKYQPFLQRAFCCLKKKRLLLCGIVPMGLFELQILSVEFVRGVKKFIFVCHVTSCHVLSMFQQLQWYFYNKRKRVLHTNLLQSNTYIHI